MYFTDIANKPVCLICGANVTVIKEFNLRMHNETKHRELQNLKAQQKMQKELKKSLRFQLTFCYQSNGTK